jgi:hypothetical protein
MQEGGCRIAFVEREAQKEFLARAATIRLRYSSGPPIEAFHYSTGRLITIDVYRAGTQR